MLHASSSKTLWSDCLSVCLDMPSPKADAFATQISSNIFKLGHDSSVDFDLQKIFSCFNQPAVMRFYEQHQKLGMDIAPFVFSMMVHVAVMLDGAEVFNPDASGHLTGVNLFLHLIGEPDKFRSYSRCIILCFCLSTNKSGLFKAFGNSMAVLSRLFPDFFIKSTVEEVNGKEKPNKTELLVSNDTELSLFQRLSKRVTNFPEYRSSPILPIHYLFEGECVHQYRWARCDQHSFRRLSGGHDGQRCKNRRIEVTLPRVRRNAKRYKNNWFHILPDRAWFHKHIGGIHRKFTPLDLPTVHDKHNDRRYSE